MQSSQVAELGWDPAPSHAKGQLQCRRESVPLGHSLPRVDRLDGVGVKVNGWNVQLVSLEHRPAGEEVGLLPDLIIFKV